MIKMKAGHHQDVATHLKVGPKNIERLARHLFKAPHHQKILEKYFPTQKFLSDVAPPAPRNLLFHPPF
jgi:hypothetical protein